MSDCKYINVSFNKLCSGDLDKYITIQSRNLKSNNPGDYSSSEQFADIKNVWAAIKTPGLSGSGNRYFNGVNLNKDTTDIFLIYYDPDLEMLETGNNFILYENQRYRIISMYDDNKNKQFFVIETSNTGLSSKDGASA